MKVAYLTAGAGGMYCGSCLRDNALAAALIAQGRDVALVPLYTPIRTDEPDASIDRVFYGGINVYLRERFRWFRRVPGFVERFLDRPGLLRLATRDVSGAEPEYLGRQTISVLRGEEGAQRRELDKLLEWIAAYGADVVHLPNAMFVGLARRMKDRLGVAVVCSLTGEDIFLDTLPEPWRNEADELIRERGRDVDGFIAVSRYYAAYATERFGFEGDRLHVVPLGVKVSDAEPSPDVPDEPFTIGYLARICPEKGLHVLCEALVHLRRCGRSCRVRAAGYLPPGERKYLSQIRSRLAGRNMGGFFQYVGEVDRQEKLRFLDSLHVFSVPAVYRESKGLYVVEALSRGVPVIEPRHGSFPELIEATGGGILFEPGDAQGLADAIGRLMDDERFRKELGCQGRCAVLESFTDELMAERAWKVFERYASANRQRSA